MSGRSAAAAEIHEGTGLPYNRYTVNHDWREAATKAGIPKSLQFRDLRATAATELADGGADLIEMSTHTGHRDAKMARRYARPTAAQMESGAKKRLAGRQKAARETGGEAGKPPLPGRSQDAEQDG
ncbi:tyrosine-type recombinase/integrase [Roseomonas sp. BN140053]|uniref:tyrosine-type recombinase/integrase n=1 Tax=Roseomonas sp. BN140053 TaxID=3391898 RepID=UPI0039E8AD02